jgi:hypothetical protein
MSVPREQFSDVKREWCRLLARLRRNGVQKTSEHVIQLIHSDPYPLTFGHRFIEHLLRRREYLAAGKIIKALDRQGIKHPILDELHSSWLWCIGRRKAALSFALGSARRWRKSYVVHHVGTLYRLMFKRTGSEYYRKKSDHYWQLAHALVKREEQEEAEQTKSY